MNPNWAILIVSARVSGYFKRGYNKRLTKETAKKYQVPEVTLKIMV